MKGKRCAWSLLVLFIIHADTYLPAFFDARYSLAQDEIHLEYGSATIFDPYHYLLENRHVLAKEKQLRFPVHGSVDMQQLGNYDITYAQNMKLRIVIFS